MLILAFETSAKACSVALLKDDILLGEAYQNTGLTHSQTLMVMAEDLMKQCAVTVNDVDAVAVAAGPGMDARRQQVYTALFKAEKGVLTRVTEDRAISLAELSEEIKILPERVFLVGDGSILCYNTLKEDVPALTLPPEHRMHQRSAGVALAAKKMLDRGEKCDGAALQPNYLRLSQAERERLEKEKNV